MRHACTLRLRRLVVVVLLALPGLGAFAGAAHAYVYWSDLGSGKIARANLDGTLANSSFIALGGGNDPVHIAVDAQHVYWADDYRDTIGRANLDGTGVNRDFITGAYYPWGIAVDGGHVYWANSNGTIGRANLDGSSVDQDFLSVSGVVALAVGGGHLYWTAILDSQTARGEIGRANLDGTGVVDDLVPGIFGPWGVAVDSGHIYWTSTASNTSAIGRADLDGTNVEPSFITGAHVPQQLAVDGSHIYWANSNTHTIGRANLDGSGVDQSLVTTPAWAGPYGVAVDSGYSSVTWTLTVSHGSGGTVTSTDGFLDCGGTCSHVYDDGATVTLHASPADAWTFSGWSGGGCSGTNACVVTLSADLTVTATFTAAPAPAITSFSPAAGGVRTPVTIAGSHFTGATEVAFGGVDARTFTVDSDTQITAVPAVGSATGFITVSTPAGTAVSASRFTFLPPPAITSFTPTAAGVNQVVTITGSHLDGATSVAVGGVPAEFVVVSPSILMLDVPFALSGAITVTAPGGTATSGAPLRVQLPPPTVGAIAPPRGRVGTLVSIPGANLTFTRSVTFGGVPASSFTVVSDSLVTAVIPVGASSGHIAVVTANGTAMSTSVFTVLPAGPVAPAITSFSPSAGMRGVRVTIRGTGFLGATLVTLNGKRAVFSVVNDSTITVVVPAGVTTGHIAVTTAGGTAQSAGAFTVLP